MAARVAVESFPAKRPLMTPATRFSGMNRACKGQGIHAVIRGPYWTGAVTRFGNTAVVTVPQAARRGSDGHHVR